MITKTDPNKTPDTVYIGTYNPEGPAGIYSFLINDHGQLGSRKLLAETRNPSFLAKSPDGRLLLTVNEIATAGTIESYAISDGALTLVDRATSGGADPCFITVIKASFVLTANYTNGSLGLLKLAADGHFSPLLDQQQQEGQGGDPVRQTSAHTHSVWLDPVNDRIIAVDLGTDQLWFYHLDQGTQKLIACDQATLPLPPGSGPRHLALHPDGRWVYVVNELSSSVSVIVKTPEGYELGPTYSTLPTGFKGENTGSDVQLTRDGKFLYVSNRGHESIAVFKVNFYDGALVLLGHKSSGGKHPRNLMLSPQEAFLLVTNQHSNNIVVLKRDKTSGLLKYCSQAAVPSPAGLVF